MAVLFASLFSISFLQFTLALLFIVGLCFRLKRDKTHVCIVVLGDIGRSPRMQYHAKSLIVEGFQVEFFGYSGSLPIDFLRDNSNVSFNYLTQWPKINILPGFVNYVCKAAFLTMQLFVIIFFKKSCPGFYLVQNPPSIPTLMVVSIISYLKGASMIIDWHNYGYTILSMNVKSSKHPLVRFSKWFEGFFGYLSDKNICVTKAMQIDLKSKWNVKADVLYDKPPEEFQRIDKVEKKAALFKKLIESKSFDEYREHEMWDSILSLCETSSENKPAVLISSTSWTEDEDFSILLDALILYENENLVKNSLPKLVCIITGKGPQKEYYKKCIREHEFKNIVVITPWLESEDYPVVIGCGDLGVSLHFSSSGLDLPMKVVDMFGCCLPVCAIDFSCLDELVKHDLNGLTFKNSSELAEQIQQLLKSVNDTNGKLSSMKTHLGENFSKNRWHENWKSVMIPIFDGN